MQGKRITANYFYINYATIDPDTRQADFKEVDLLDMFEWYRRSEVFNPVRTTKMVFGDMGRLQIAQPVSGNENLYELQFLRLRSSNPGQIADSEGNLRKLELEDGAYLAESASALIDTSRNWLLLEENYFGANRGFIEEYINSLFCDYIRNVHFRLITMKDPKKDYNWIWGKQIRSLVGEFVEPQTEPENIEDAIADAWRMKATRCTLKMSVGRSRKGALSVADANRMVNKWFDRSDVERIKIGYKGKDNRTSVLDLMEERMYNQFTLDKKGDELVHDRIVAKLVQSHLERLKNYENV